MGLLRRRGSGPEASYARVLDGRHLWLAVSGADELALRSEGRDDVPVPSASDGDLRTAVFALDLVAGDELTVVAGAGRRAVPVTHADPLDPGPTHLQPGPWRVVDVGGGVVLRREAHQPTIEATGFAVTDRGVVVQLSSRDLSSAELCDGETVLSEHVVVDGRVELAEQPALPAGTTAPLRAGGAPVVRAANVLARPHVSVALPPMPEMDVELRWLRDGRLAVHRKAPSP